MFSTKISFDSTDATGSPGNATINKPTGRVAIAAAAASVVVTNSLVLATSQVFIQALGVDATGLLPRVSNIGAGSFTITVSAAATGNLSFCFLVVN